MSALAGRVAELARLRGQLARVAADSAFESLLVEGEPGIGKSRLLRELAGLAIESGFRVLEARADEWERDLPYAVLAEALEPALPGLLADADALGPAERQGLAMILPELADAAAAALIPDRRYLAHRALGALLEREAADRGCLLVVDDVQWTDPATIDVLSGLLRRRGAAPVLVALGCRSGQVPDRLSSALAAAGREDRAEHLVLPPLTRDEAAGLLEGPDRARRLDRVYDLSGGNPFYLEQLDRAATLPQPEPTDALPVPTAVRSSLSAELHALDPASRAVLEAAAVAGDPFDLDLVEAVAERDVLEALDVLVRQGLVRATGVPRRFAFRHPLVRAAVYEFAGGGWLIGAHGRAAAALAERGAPAAALAQHLEHVARVGDEAAVGTFAAAGSDALARAPMTAARWYDAALRTLAPGPGTEEQQRRLQLARAMALGNAGRVDDALAQLEVVLAGLPRDEALVRARLDFECARIEVLVGRPGRARDRCRAALEPIGDRAHVFVVRNWQALGAACLAEHDFDAAREAEERALLLLAELDEPALEFHAHAELALGYVTEGVDRDAADLHLDCAIEALDRSSDSQVAEYAESVYVLALAAVILGRWAAALTHVDRAIRVAVAHGVPRALVPLMVARSEALLWLGRVEESHATAEEAVEAARAAGHPQFTFWALWNHARALMWLGRTDEAVPVAEESLEVAAGRPRNFLSDAEPEWQAGNVFLAAGQTARALELLLRGFGGPDAPRVIPIDRVLAWERLLEASLATGDLEAARTYAARMTGAVDDAFALPVVRAAAARGQGLLAVTEGAGLDAAGRALDEALTQLGDTDAVLELAATLLCAGRVRAALGSRDEAIADLERAEAVFAASGVEDGRAACARELRRLGRRTGSARRSPGEGGTGLAALSAREREVAELVGEGETNKAIGRRLFLSEKTVEAHLRNVFLKLGVSSRAAVAAAVVAAVAAEEPVPPR